jgi:hypothetical protein
LIYQALKKIRFYFRNIREVPETNMMTTFGGTKAPESEIEFIPTPKPAQQTLNTNEDCGVKIISVRINSRN